MIRTEEGITVFAGTQDDILTDFGCIVLSLTKLMYKKVTRKNKFVIG